MYICASGIYFVVAQFVGLEGDGSCIMCASGIDFVVAQFVGCNLELFWCCGIFLFYCKIIVILI